MVYWLLLYIGTACFTCYASLVSLVDSYQEHGLDLYSVVGDELDFHAYTPCE
jgi:hypothetical protein